MNKKFDFEGIFTLTAKAFDSSDRIVYSGYRPQHQINDDYQTSGDHEYPFVAQVKTGESATAFVKFITSEYYPHCIYENQVINVCEGSHKVGELTVLKILNPILMQRSSNKQDRFLFRVENVFTLNDLLVLHPGFIPTNEPVKPGQTIKIIDPDGNSISTKIAGLISLYPSMKEKPIAITKLQDEEIKIGSDVWCCYE